MGIVTPIPDRNTIDRAVQVLLDGQQLAELRVLNNGKTQRGYYDDLDRLAADASSTASQPGSNVYFLLNEPKPKLAGRADNCLAYGTATKDSDVDRRRWVLVDVDPLRPAGTSAADAEKENADETTRSIIAHLHAQGFPDPVLVDSGNGFHLLFAADLPNTTQVKTACRQFLRALAAKFDSRIVSIDQSVYNAARISKLPGTVTRKGPADDPERPHRTSRLLSIPESREKVSIEQLQQVAGTSETEPPLPQPASPTGDKRDIPAMLKKHNLAFHHRAAYETEQGLADLYQLRQCPWSDKHTTGPGGATKRV